MASLPVCQVWQACWPDCDDHRPRVQQRTSVSLTRRRLCTRCTLAAMLQADGCNTVLNITSTYCLVRRLCSVHLRVLVVVARASRFCNTGAAPGQHVWRAAWLLNTLCSTQHPLVLLLLLSHRCHTQQADSFYLTGCQGQWRFCQQCGKAEPLSAFDGNKRSCRCGAAAGGACNMLKEIQCPGCMRQPPPPPVPHACMPCAPPPTPLRLPRTTAGSNSKSGEQPARRTEHAARARATVVVVMVCSSITPPTARRAVM